MFYCEECRVKMKWPESWSKSYGSCEVCGYTRPCYDVHHSQLPKLEKCDEKAKDA